MTAPIAPQASNAVPAAVHLSPGDSVALEFRSLVVVKGRVELYAMVAGRRHYIAELSAEARLFPGCPGLIAIAPEGALLRDSASGTDAPESVSPDSLAQQLDAWIVALAAGVARLSTRRPALHCAVAGERLPTASADTRPQAEGIAAGSGVIWITATQPTLRYMGQGIAGCGPLPVTASGWLTREPFVEAFASTTAQVLREHGASALLAGFHAALAGAAADIIAEAEATEAARLAEREAQSVAASTEADLRLRNVLDEKHGRFVPEHDDNGFVLDRLFPGLTVPANQPSLRSAAEAGGVNARTVVLEDGWWRRDHGRLAATLIADGRPVALMPGWLGRYRMHIRGESAVPVTVALAARIDRQALAMTRALPNRPIKTWEVPLFGLMYCRADLLSLALAGLVASLLGLAVPLAMGTLIDNFVSNQLRNQTVLLGVALAMLTVCNGLLHAASDLARMRIDATISMQLQSGIIDRVMRLPSRLLRSLTSADLSMRVLSIEQMRRALIGVGLNTVLGGLFGISNLVVLYFYNPAGTALAATLFMAMLAAAIGAGLMQLRTLMIGERMTANVVAQTLQLIQNVATLRAFGAERRAYANWARNTAALRARMLRSRRMGVLFECFLSAYDVLALAAVFAVLGFAGSAANVSIGSYLAFVGVYEAFLFTSEGLARGVTQVLALQPMMKRASLVLDTPPESSPAAHNPGALVGSVEVSGISFRYGSDLPMVLNDVSFMAEPGRFIAITGPSGSGKSTLIKLMLGFDEPQAGAILFDGQEMSRLNRTAVRRQIGVVRQNGRLLAASIHENILGLHPGTLQDAWNAAELAGVADDIRALPMGMHTILNDGATTLSGGQVQRLLIARALAGNPRILMLDEATSALDNRAQEQVSQNIERLGMTRIVVAHRLSTVRHADVIHFLESGRIVESGTFDALMASNGHFARFAQRQLL